MSKDSILKQLVDMSRHLDDPAHDYAILGEGNTPARIDAAYAVKTASRT
jgi:hypothetical protein